MYKNIDLTKVIYDVLDYYKIPKQVNVFENILTCTELLNLMIGAKLTDISLIETVQFFGNILRIRDCTSSYTTARHKLDFPERYTATIPYEDSIYVLDDYITKLHPGSYIFKLIWDYRVAPTTNTNPIKHLISNLSEQELYILQHRLIYGETNATIGEQLSISASRAHQLASRLVIRMCTMYKDLIPNQDITNYLFVLPDNSIIYGDSIKWVMDKL